MPISMSRLESGQYYLIKLKTEYSSAMTSYIGTFVGLIPYEKSKEPKFQGTGFITPIYDEGHDVAYFTHVASVPSFEKINLKVCGTAYEFLEVPHYYIRQYEDYLRKQRPTYSITRTSRSPDSSNLTSYTKITTYGNLKKKNKKGTRKRQRKR